jgi:hypothetical protein
MMNLIMRGGLLIIDGDEFQLGYNEPGASCSGEHLRLTTVCTTRDR